MERTRFSLPFDGRVVDSQAEVGQLLNQGQKFGEAFDIKSIEALVPISPRDLENIQPAIGRTAKVRIGIQDFTAKIAESHQNLDERTRFAQLYLDIESIGNLYPGSFIDVTIEGPKLQNTVLLPEAAEQINESVWTVSDGKLTKNSLNLLIGVVTGIVVESFSLGEGVVLGTVPGAREGMAVTTEELVQSKDNQSDFSAKGILDYFAANLVAANLMMFIMLLGGFIAASSLTAQSFPTINLGQINITVPYPGATPSEVEESITRRIEEVLLGIDGGSGLPPGLMKIPAQCL